MISVGVREVWATRSDWVFWEDTPSSCWSGDWAAGGRSGSRDAGWEATALVCGQGDGMWACVETVGMEGSGVCQLGFGDRRGHGAAGQQQLGWCPGLWLGHWWTVQKGRNPGAGSGEFGVGRTAPEEACGPHGGCQSGSWIPSLESRELEVRIRKAACTQPRKTGPGASSR